MKFKFPNKLAIVGKPGDNGWEVDVPIEKWVATKEQQITLYINGDGLYLQTVNSYYGNLNGAQLILGWERSPFPHCCGFTIVSNLNFNYFSDEVREQWWNWIQPTMNNVMIGVVARKLDFNSNIMQPVYSPDSYNWIAKKGVQIADPIKNVLYHDHVLCTYIWYPQDMMDKVINPTYGMNN